MENYVYWWKAKSSLQLHPTEFKKLRDLENHPESIKTKTTSINNKVIYETETNFFKWLIWNIHTPFLLFYREPRKVS